MFPFAFPGFICLHPFCFGSFGVIFSRFGSSGLACVGYLPPNSPLWHFPSAFCSFCFFWFIFVLFSWLFSSPFSSGTEGRSCRLVCMLCPFFGRHFSKRIGLSFSWPPPRSQLIAYILRLTEMARLGNFHPLRTS